MTTSKIDILRKDNLATVIRAGTYVQHPEEIALVMRGINNNWRQLSAQEINAGRHRGVAGGLWHEIGQLQFSFLKSQGLQPHHTFIDVGCGPLRGGVHFIKYLEPGHYHGLDVNESVIIGGLKELALAGILNKHPTLLINNAFELWRFETHFDYGIACSLFTHLNASLILVCLRAVRKALKPRGKFYASYFEAPAPRFRSPLVHQPGNITTYSDANPFHYAFQEMESLAEQSGFQVESIGEWGHPRAQQMLCFSPTRPA